MLINHKFNYSCPQSVIGECALLLADFQLGTVDRAHVEARLAQLRVSNPECKGNIDAFLGELILRVREKGG